MIDIPSLLIGKALGSGGGSGGGLAVWQVGYFGFGEGKPDTSITVEINGYKGKYALISVMHRAALTAPSGCILLDKTTYVNIDTTQYVSVFKASIDSDSASFTFTQDESVRISATAWVIGINFTIDKVATGEFRYYIEKYNITASNLSFVTFSAVNSTSVYTAHDFVADSNGVWLCQPVPHYDGNNTYKATPKLRHFSGVIPATAEERTVWVQEKTPASVDLSSQTSEAQVVTYTISAA